MKKHQFAAMILVVLISLFCFSPGFANASKSDEVKAKASSSQGMMNIVKRAYQMTNIQWTPLADISVWNGELTYRAGTTYIGLPYGQPVTTGNHDGDYVPREATLSEARYLCKIGKVEPFLQQPQNNKI